MLSLINPSNVTIEWIICIYILLYCAWLHIIIIIIIIMAAWQSQVQGTATTSTNFSSLSAWRKVASWCCKLATFHMLLLYHGFPWCCWCKKILYHLRIVVDSPYQLVQDFFHQQHHLIIPDSFVGEFFREMDSSNQKSWFLTLDKMVSLRVPRHAHVVYVYFFSSTPHAFWTFATIPIEIYAPSTP